MESVPDNRSDSNMSYVTCEPFIEDPVLTWIHAVSNETVNDRPASTPEDAVLLKRQIIDELRSDVIERKMGDENTNGKTVPAESPSVSYPDPPNRAETEIEDREANCLECDALLKTLQEREDVISEHEATIRTLVSRKAALQRDLGELHLAQEKHRASLSQIEERLWTKEEEPSESIKGIDFHVEKLREQVEYIGSRLVLIQRHYWMQSSTMDVMRLYEEQLEEEKARLVSVHEEQVKMFGALEASMHDLQQEKETLTGEKEIAVASLNDVRSELESTQAERNDLRRRLEVSESTIKALRLTADRHVLEAADQQNALNLTAFELQSTRAERDDLRHRLVVAESQIKILQFEADRPLWEETARQRAAEEKAQEEAENARKRKEVEESKRRMSEMKEEEQRRMEAEAKKRADEKRNEDMKEFSRKWKEMREKEDKRRAEAETQKRRMDEEIRRAEDAARRGWAEELSRRAQRKAEQETAARARKAEGEEVETTTWYSATRMQERKCRTRIESQWPAASWTDKVALDRFEVLSSEFVSYKFTQQDPLTSGMVPWPVLMHPIHYKIEEVNWERVQEFFKRAKDQFSDQAYRTLLERTQRMFHPDRWLARRILATVINGGDREGLTEAGSRVSQAVNALYTASKDS